MATNDAMATNIVKLYAKPGIPSRKPIKPPAKQMLAIVELNFCCCTSSGIYDFKSFFRNNFAKCIIGLTPVKIPKRFAISGIAKIQYCPVIHVRTTELKIVH